MIRIRFKANSGIFGIAMTDENPNGEYPEGYEIEVEAVPGAWANKVDIVGTVKAGAVAVTGDAPKRGRPAKSDDDKAGDKAGDDDKDKAEI